MISRLCACLDTCDPDEVPVLLLALADAMEEAGDVRVTGARLWQSGLVRPTGEGRWFVDAATLPCPLEERAEWLDIRNDGRLCLVTPYQTRSAAFIALARALTEETART